MRIAWTTLVSLFPSKMPWLNKEQANGRVSTDWVNTDQWEVWPKVSRYDILLYKFMPIKEEFVLNEKAWTYTATFRGMLLLRRSDVMPINIYKRMVYHEPRKGVGCSLQSKGCSTTKRMAHTSHERKEIHWARSLLRAIYLYISLRKATSNSTGIPIRIKNERTEFHTLKKACHKNPIHILHQ